MFTGIVAAVGRIERRLAKDAKPGAVCEECSDDRKGKPIDGLEIIRHARKAEGKDVWEGGKILDPENGREYTLRLTPQEGGRKLDVRGSKCTPAVDLLLPVPCAVAPPRVAPVVKAATTRRISKRL
mgnify:CR=1 FL=1